MNMKKYALILHAWFNHPQDNWYPWLAKELIDRGYKVYMPEIPTLDTNTPDMDKALSSIKKSIPLTKDSIIIGHSLGALLAMRLAEKQEFQKIFLIEGWDFDDLTREHISFWKTKINHTAIKKHIKDIFVVASDNDPYMTPFTEEEMSKRLGGTFILVKGAGHFLKKTGVTTIPQLLKYIS